MENAAVSTVVQSDVPIVSERSMYWPGDALPFGEGHNSAGVVTTATHWGLADEGRVGGPQQFQTYVLLANPESTAAEMTVTFLCENGTPPVVKTYTVPATSRFDIDLATVQELSNESFGVRIDVTNSPVERSLYGMRTACSGQAARTRWPRRCRKRRRGVDLSLASPHVCSASWKTKGARVAVRKTKMKCSLLEIPNETHAR